MLVAQASAALATSVSDNDGIGINTDVQSSDRPNTEVSPRGWSTAATVAWDMQPNATAGQPRDAIVTNRAECTLIDSGSSTSYGAGYETTEPLQKRARGPWYEGIIDNGRMIELTHEGSFLATAMLADVKGANDIITTELRNPPDPLGLSYQRNLIRVSHMKQFLDEWTETKYNNPDIRLEMTAPVLTALGTLSVGDKEPQSVGRLWWRRRRKVDAKIYPSGPNVALHHDQDQKYWSEPSNDGQPSKLEVWHVRCVVVILADWRSSGELWLLLHRDQSR